MMVFISCLLSRVPDNGKRTGLVSLLILLFCDGGGFAPEDAEVSGGAGGCGGRGGADERGRKMAELVLQRGRRQRVRPPQSVAVSGDGGDAVILLVGILQRMRLQDGDDNTL